MAGCQVAGEVRLPTMAMELLGGSLRMQDTLPGGATLTLCRLASDILVTLVPCGRGGNRSVFRLAHELRDEPLHSVHGENRVRTLQQQLVITIADLLASTTQAYSYISPVGAAVRLELLDGGAVVITIQHPWGSCRQDQVDDVSPCSTVVAQDAPKDDSTVDSIANHPLCAARGLAMATS